MKNIEEFKRYEIGEDSHKNIEVVEQIDKFHTMQYEQLITKTWCNINFAEEPEIKINGVDYNWKQEFDGRQLFAQLISKGEILVIPDIADGQVKYRTKTLDGIDYLENAIGELIYIKFTDEIKELVDYESFDTKTRIRKTIYYIDDTSKKCVGLIYNDDILDESQQIEYQKIPVFIARYSNEQINGEPIWFNAIGTIKQLNKSDYFQDIDREISAKMVGLPDPFLETASRSKTKTPMMKGSRLLRLIPGLEDSKPIIFDGNYNPDNYISEKNWFLHILSKQVGLGNKYFSYDDNAGLKTATEVVSDKSELYQTKLIHDELIEILFKKLIQLAYIKLNIEYLDSSFAFKFGDAIIKDDVAYQQQLYADNLAGFISNEFYLEQIYDDDADKAKPSTDVQSLTDGQTNGFVNA